MSPLAWLLLGFGLGAATLVLAELGARAWLARRGQYYVWPPFFRARYELDRTALPMLEPVVRWEINAVGERGRPLPADLEHTYRVVAAGGSTTECYFIDQQSTWPAVLEELLRRPENRARLGAEDVYVGNIGRSVTSSGYLVEIFERCLHRYPRLDLVVLFVGASDLVLWMQARMPSPWTPGRAPVERIYGENPEGPFGWTPRTMALRRTASGLKRRLLKPLGRSSGVGKRVVEVRRMRTRAKHLIVEEPDITPVMLQWEQHLRELFALLRRRAKRVLFVPNPWFEKAEYSEEERLRFWNFGLGKPYEEEVDTYFDLPIVARMLHRLADRGIQIAREMGCEALDMMPLIEASSRNYYDYLHHTPAGNREVARILAEAVLQSAPSRPADAVPSGERGASHARA